MDDDLVGAPTPSSTVTLTSEPCASAGPRTPVRDKAVTEPWGPGRAWAVCMEESDKATEEAGETVGPSLQNQPDLGPRSGKSPSSDATAGGWASGRGQGGGPWRHGQVSLGRWGGLGGQDSVAS